MGIFDSQNMQIVVPKDIWGHLEQGGKIANLAFFIPKMAFFDSSNMQICEISKWLLEAFGAKNTDTIFYQISAD